MNLKVSKAGYMGGDWGRIGKGEIKKYFKFEKI